MTSSRLFIRRMLPTFVWCLMVLIGVLVLVFGQTKPPGPVAKRPLPMNTLLMKNDLVPDDFSNRYVVVPNGIPVGTPLRPQDVAVQPVLPAGLAHGTYFSLPAAAYDISDGLNAGAAVPLCGKGGRVFGMAQVLVVRCDPDGPGVSCSALVQVDDKVGSDLAANGIKAQTSAKDLTLSLRCKP